MTESLGAYPGGDLIEKGLRNLNEGQITEEALLVMIAAARLEGLGIKLPPFPEIPTPYEHQLFHALNRRIPERAHYEYNTLIARIVSFANAYGIANRNKTDTLTSHP